MSAHAHPMNHADWTLINYIVKQHGNAAFFWLDKGIDPDGEKTRTYTLRIKFAHVCFSAQHDIYTYSLS